MHYCFNWQIVITTETDPQADVKLSFICRAITVQVFNCWLGQASVCVEYFLISFGCIIIIHSCSGLSRSRVFKGTPVLISIYTQYCFICCWMFMSAVFPDVYILQWLKNSVTFGICSFLSFCISENWCIHFIVQIAGGILDVCGRKIYW